MDLEGDLEGDLGLQRISDENPKRTCSSQVRSRSGLVRVSSSPGLVHFTA